jgi:Flp pilus assembly protein TadB
MKQSLVICALILIVAALLGWREEQQISRTREINAKLATEAAAIPNEGIRVRLSHNALTDSELKRKKVRIMC